MTISIDTSTLISYYNSKAGILDSSTGAATSSSSTSATGTSSSSSTSTAPTPPWQLSSAPSAAALALEVINGQSIINTNSAQLDVKGASADYQSLFTAYQGLSALSGLAADALATNASATTTVSPAQATQALAAGLTQVSSYINGLSLTKLRLTTGTVQSSDVTTDGPATTNASYTTGVIFSGGANDPVGAFQGDVQFNINVTNYKGVQTTVPIDLSQLGSTPRTFPNVVSYINSQLKAAGVITRFATAETPGEPQTVTVGGQKVTLPATADQWAFKVVGDTSESVSFSAPASAPAVYVAQTSGNVLAYNAQTAAAAAAPALAAEGITQAPSASTVSAPVQQIVKLQADGSGTAPPAAQVIPGTPNASPDEAYAKTLDPNISSVGATATGSDGSLYVLANVTGTVDGDTPQGAQNVALQKYDSAGNLIYSTLIGSTGSASGLSLAVSADGKVAIAGSVTGALSPTNTGNGATTADSFVAVYNSQGEQQWATTGPSPTNNQVNAVAFGANDAVYVAGQTNVANATSTAPSYGSPQGYLAGYSSTGAQTFSVGASGITDPTGLAVDGATIVVAGTDAGAGVLNSYTVAAKGAPTLNATRNIGALGSGAIAGVAINNGQVVVAGTTTNSALNAGATTSAFSGSQDAFVAQVSESLAPSVGDAVAYYGGSGSTRATALTVSNGQVYIAGTSSGGLAGLTNTGKQEGFVANVDVASGQVPWSQALAGQDGIDAPTSVAVASSGAGVLDRLGLPTQTLQYNSSQLLTAAAPVSAGDQFQVLTRVGGTPSTVTISATDTPQTLAQKITAASGYEVNVNILPSGGKNQIEITPQNTGQSIELLPGPSGQDALAPLGLTPGVIQSAPAIITPPKANPALGITAAKAASSVSGQVDTYGLNLDQNFNLTTTAGIQAAQKAINNAITTLQTAYTNLANPTASTPAVTGTAPAYITAELANYQAGLARLTGGSSTTNSGSSLASSLASILT